MNELRWTEFEYHNDDHVARHFDICGFFSPFAKPFFEGAKRRRLRLECAACFQRFILGRDGSTYRIG